MEKKNTNYVNQKTLEGFIANLVAILEDVQRGNGKVERWKQAWKNMQSRFHNPTTKSYYSGINVLSCLITNYFLQTNETRFLTFNKAKELAENWGMKPGKENPIISYDNLSKNGTPIMYWGIGHKMVTDPTTGKEEEKIYRFVTGFRLHNLSLFSAEFQAKFNEVYGEPVEIDKTIPDEIGEFTAMVNAHIGATIEFTNETSGPVYYPLVHKIKMPFPAQYTGNLEQVKHDFLHEAAHATKKVCGRDLKDYAREEIVAETSAAFLCLEMGINLNPEYLAYILGWLKGNPAKTVMSLFGHIETACAVIMGRYSPKAATPEAEAEPEAEAAEV